MEKTNNSVIYTYEEMMKSRGWDRVIFLDKNQKDEVSKDLDENNNETLILV